MPVLLVNALVVLFQVTVQPLRQRVLVLVASADGADIIYRDGLFHNTVKVRREARAANADSGGFMVLFTCGRV